MLKFISVKYKNFLSTGNRWNEYKLDAHSSTLIIGTNGSGKTTLLDALCFGLYGKAFRNINKPTLVNSINEKNLVVEVTFATQNNTYVVRRGVKPTIFDIICNGKALPEFPSASEMQTYLEKYILKCNYKAFTQVVILGSSSYVAFMRLTPAARREVLEDVLDIEVFSIMQTLAKDRLSTIKDDYQKAQSRLLVAQSSQSLSEQYTQQWEKMQEDTRNKLQRQKDAILLSIDDINAKMAEMLDAEAQWKKIADTVVDLDAKHTKVVSAVSKYSTELQRHQHTHDFFTKHDNCPLCTQSIDATFKEAQLTSSDAVISETKQKLTEMESLAALTQKKLTTARDAVVTVRQIQTEYRSMGKQIAAYQSQITEIDAQIQATHAPVPEIDMNIAAEVAAATEELDGIHYEKIICEQCIGLLKDNGIRTKVIQQYLPIINHWVNYYLHSMNFPVQFTIDEQFNEIIKSRHRDAFSYENFSDGEKRRIDLALVLTWRAIARMKNSVYTNILIFDEIFDSSLDSAGTDDFLRLLETMDIDTNVFVISHKTDALIDKFKSVVMVSKDRGFSVAKVL